MHVEKPCKYYILVMRQQCTNWQKVTVAEGPCQILASKMNEDAATVLAGIHTVPGCLEEPDEDPKE